MKITLVRAWSRRSESRVVELPQGASIADALVAAGWDADPEAVGAAIFGQVATAATPLRDGDRVELLRPLAMDPKLARRRRAAGTSGR